jgi:hypothetical protein
MFLTVFIMFFFTMFDKKNQIVCMKDFMLEGAHIL